MRDAQYRVSLARVLWLSWNPASLWALAKLRQLLVARDVPDLFAANALSKEPLAPRAEFLFVDA